MFFNRKPESLYIHIPFCAKKCSYCDFFSISDPEPSLISSLLAETVKQLDYFNSVYDIAGVKTIYIGGGTPSFLKPKILSDFIANILKRYDSLPEEFTVETNPETVTEEYIAVLNDLPVTRISVGIQSFNQELLTRLGRNCRAASNFKALDLLRNLDNKSISLDIISSIPGQSVNSSLEDAKTAISFDPVHISLYNLTLEKNTLLADRYTEKEQDENCWVESAEYLSANGYNHYEISNFALPGNECKHNMNYWRMYPYIGCGLTAVSTVYENGYGLRYTNTSNPALFLKSIDNLWDLKKERIDKYDLLVEILMMAFRTEEGISVNDIDKSFAIDIGKILSSVTDKWYKNGFLEISGGRISLNRRGRFFHNSFMLDILSYFDKVKFRFT